MYYDFESPEGKQKLVQKGQYEVKNSFVRIELSEELKSGLLAPDLLPAGFQGHSHLFTKSDGNFVEKIANNFKELKTNVAKKLGGRSCDNQSGDSFTGYEPKLNYPSRWWKC